MIYINILPITNVLRFLQGHVEPVLLFTIPFMV